MHNHDSAGIVHHVHDLPEGGRKACSGGIKNSPESQLGNEKDTTDNTIR